MALTEADVLSKHTQALKEASECCQLLARNADPEKAAPRGHIYGNLRRALTSIEGTCRQMCYFREDTRWIKLGILYANAMRKCSQMFANQNWMGFGQIRKLFDEGLRRMDDLANLKTGQRGPILPTKPTGWLIMPDLQTGMQRRLATRH